MKITVERSGITPDFVKGELVELNRELFDDDKGGYIVMVTSYCTHSYSFCGVIVQSDLEGSEVGDYENSFGKSKFIKFHGTLSLEV